MRPDSETRGIDDEQGFSPRGGVATTSGFMIMPVPYGAPPWEHGRIECEMCRSVVAQCGCAQSTRVVATVNKCPRCACGQRAARPGDPVFTRMEEQKGTPWRKTTV